MRFLCVLIGYFCGCFLTAEVVARRRTGKSACEIGSRNPGMANMAETLGVSWGALTLLGDVLKTAVPSLLCRYVFFPSLGQIAVLYTGAGVALGHGFPFWNRFRGGRSVAVTCTYLVLFAPMWGILADLTGLLVMLATRYPAVGALTIPTVYLLPVFLNYGPEPGLVALAGTALMFFLHRDSLRRIAGGVEKKVSFRGKVL